MNTTKADYEPHIILSKDFNEDASDCELRHILEYMPEIYKDMVKELNKNEE